MVSFKKVMKIFTGLALAFSICAVAGAQQQDERPVRLGNREEMNMGLHRPLT